MTVNGCKLISSLAKCTEWKKKGERFHHCLTELYFRNNGDWVYCVRQILTLGLKMEARGHSGRECLCSDSLSLPRALRAGTGQVSVYRARANPIKDPSSGGPPPACHTWWLERDTIKVVQQDKREKERRLNHERASYRCVLQKYGLHWQYETHRPVHREEGNKVSQCHILRGISCYYGDLVKAMTKNYSTISHRWMIFISFSLEGETGETEYDFFWRQILPSQCYI